MSLFRLGRKKDDALGETRRRVADLVRSNLDLGEHDAVTVSEIACGDPDCGGAETVILILRAGARTEAVKVRKALRLVDDREILDALQSAALR